MDNFLTDYIKAIENPNKVGWNGKVWTAPNLKGYDPNQRGYGIDIRYNDSAKALTKNRKGQWLTDSEATNLMNDHLNYLKGVALRKIKGFDNFSPKKQAIILGMLYRGDSVLSNVDMNEQDDTKFMNSVHNYYISKGLNERAKNSSNFFNKQQQKRNIVPNFTIPNTNYVLLPDNLRVLKPMIFLQGGLFSMLANSPAKEWGNDWKRRNQSSKVLRLWTGKEKPKRDWKKEEQERIQKQTIPLRTWRSDVADTLHGIGEGVLALNPYTAIPYYGAKVGLDFLNGTYGWHTALNASVPLFHMAPQAVGLKEATNVALEDAANLGSKTAKNWRVAREINLATKNKPKYIRVPSKNLFRTQVYKGGEITDPYSNFVTTDPLYAANYGKVTPYIFESKSIVKAKEPMMGYRDPVSLDMFIYNNTKRNPNATAIIGHDAITGEFIPSKGIEILNMNPKNLYPVRISDSPTSLKFFERNPSRISEAERAGVPKGERNVKRGYLLKDAIEEANKFAEKWGYDKLSQNATLLDIENLYNQHNTFFRGVTTEQLENTRSRVTKELGINPELLTNDLYLLYVSTHPWPGNDRIWVTPFSHYGKMYGNSDMIGGKGLLSAVMRPWKTTKDIKQWPKLSLWTLGFKEDVSNPVITPWISNAPDAIRSLGALSELLVKPPLIYRGLGKDFKGTLLLQLKYNDGQGKLGWIESLVGELPLEIIIEKQGGKMNVIQQFKNRRK